MLLNWIEESWMLLRRIELSWILLSCADAGPLPWVKAVTGTSASGTASMPAGACVLSTVNPSPSNDGSAVDVGEAVLVGVGVDVLVAEGVGVFVAVRVGVLVKVAVAVNVRVAVGVGVRESSQAPGHVVMEDAGGPALY